MMCQRLTGAGSKFRMCHHAGTGHDFVDTWVVMFLTNLGAPSETSQKTGAAFFSPGLLSALDPAVPFNLLIAR